MDAEPSDPAEQWSDAIEKAMRSRRIVVLGATDVGKSSFIRRFASVAGEIGLIDLDPGQKMVGPPGSASYGRIDPAGEARLARFIFLGTTSASALSVIARSGEALAGIARGHGRYIVNTSGYVRGPGARLQAWTAASVEADLVVEIADDLSHPPILADPGRARLVRIGRSPFARRKSAARRAAIRQAAFEHALAGAAPQRLPFGNLRFAPAPPAIGIEPARPVCSLANRAGADMTIGIVQDIGDTDALIISAPPPERVHEIRLGRMWASQGEDGWRLLERLSPGWIQEEQG